MERIPLSFFSVPWRSAASTAGHWSYCDSCAPWETLGLHSNRPFTMDSICFICLSCRSSAVDNKWNGLRIISFLIWIWKAALSCFSSFLCKKKNQKPFLSLNFRFEVMITGCRLAVLFHSLISLNCQWSVTFKVCNYENAISSTLTLLCSKKRRKIAFTIHHHSPFKKKRIQSDDVLVVADEQTIQRQKLRQEMDMSKHFIFYQRCDLIQPDLSPFTRLSETLKDNLLAIIPLWTFFAFPMAY